MARMTAARFGDLTLLVTRYTEEGVGRDWVTQSPARGDEHVLQERGRRQRRTACELLFCDEPGRGDYLDRWLAFRALTELVSPSLFVHPTDGAYLAVAQDPRPTVDATRRCVAVAVTFVAAEQPRSVFPVGAGVTPGVGPEQVGVLATAATTELAAAGFTSSAPASCLATVEGWAAGDDVDARAIELQAATLASAIDDEVERFALLSDLSRWPAYRALLRLRYAVTRAASAATSETANVMRYTVTASVPLRALCAQIFGARDADRTTQQVLRLNGLRTPGMVPAGTMLLLPAEGR